MRAAAVGSLLIVSLGCSRISSAATGGPLGWPMPGHDPQRTSRASVNGPVHPRLLWSRSHVLGQVVGPDGTIYGLRQRRGHFPYTVAISAAGRQRAVYHTTLPPAGVSPSGVVFAIGFEHSGNGVGPAQPQDAAVAGFSPRGKLLWKIQPAGLLKGAEPLVSADGTLYAPFEGMGEGFAGLDLISPDGRQRYLQRGMAFFAVALAPTGTIYALTFSHETHASSVEALDPSGNVRWQRPLDASLESSGCRCLLVGADGTVYVTDGTTLLALETSGDLRWRRQTTNGALALAERADGVLLIAGRDQLAAVSPAGQQLWTSPIGTTWPAQYPSLIADGAGRAYVATGDGLLNIISPQGQLLSRLRVAPASRTVPSPSLLLGSSGRLVVSTEERTSMYGG